VNVVALAPTPSPRVAMAKREKAGARRKVRKP